MPTDLGVAFERKGEAQAQTQTEITLVLVWLIICLVMFVLLFADQSFAKANIEWMCLF
jgi:preprotein translocase subunit SecG